MNINLATIDLCPGQGGGVDPSGTLDITSNGEYDVYSYASASVSVHPSNSLSETYTTNGTKTITGEFNGGTVNVDVHPSNVFSGSYSSNGIYNISGEFNGGTVNVDVHPSNVFSGSYSSNGIYNISGEFNGGEITVEVPAPQFITETLNVSANNTYYPGSGVNGFSEVVVNVPQSVTGFTDKEITEGVHIVNLSNSASYVNPYVFVNNTYLQTISLPNCTSVGEMAFARCSNLQSVDIPNCEVIRYSGFTSCSKLTSFNIPNVIEIWNGAFRFCSSLTAISVPKCVYIGTDAFQDCSNLEEIYSPNLLRISTNTFQNCKISSLNLPNFRYVENGGYGVFNNCSLLSEVNLPNCVGLQDSMFTGCSSLETISVPNLMQLGGLVFDKCSNVSEFVFPDLTYIKGATFNNLKNGNINVISLPNLLWIDKWYGNPVLLNTSLSDLYIGTDVYGVLDYTSVISGTTTTITGSIYVNGYEYNNYITANGWSSISSMLVPVGDTSVPMLQYSDGTIYGNTGAITSSYLSYISKNKNDITEVNLSKCRVVYSNTFTGYSTLTSVNLPMCKTIGSLAFQNCSNLVNLSLPMCKNILSNTFQDCRSLESLDLPVCEYVGFSAFQNCLHLSSISLPMCRFIETFGFSGVGRSCSEMMSVNLPVCEYIGDYAFWWARKLNAITLGSNKVCDIEGSDIFATTPIGEGTGSIYVPASLVDAYKSALYWSRYSSRIFPISE